MHSNRSNEKSNAVELKDTDKGRPRGLNENKTPGSVSGHDPSRTIGRGDLPYDRPRDDTRNNTTALIDSNPTAVWGRPAPELKRRSWESYAASPNSLRPNPDVAPARPDFGAPSHDAYDVRGMGESGDPGTPGQPGKNPSGKSSDWA